MTAHKTPTTDADLREAIDRAVKHSEHKRADIDTCPDCRKKAALLSLTFRGVRVGRLCRFCEFTTFATVPEDKRTKLRLVKGKKARVVTTKAADA